MCHLLRMSYRVMMALTSGALIACTCALGTRAPSYSGKPARTFLMREARGPQETAGYVVALEPFPWGGRIQKHRTRGSSGALSRREAGSEAMKHMVASESSLVKKRGPEPLNTW
jgi:hypothetical protein